MAMMNMNPSLYFSTCIAFIELNIMLWRMSILPTDYREEQYICALSRCEFDGIEDAEWLQHRHSERAVVDLAELVQSVVDSVWSSNALILTIQYKRLLHGNAN